MALESGSPEEDKVEFQKIVIEALQVVEEALRSEVEQSERRMKTYSSSAVKSYDYFDDQEEMFRARAELANFVKALRERDEESLSYWLACFEHVIVRSEAGKAFMARRPLARRTRDKAERLVSLRRKLGAQTMKFEIGEINFSPRLNWQNLDRMTRDLLQIN